MDVIRYFHSSQPSQFFVVLWKTSWNNEQWQKWPRSYKLQTKFFVKHQKLYTMSKANQWVGEWHQQTDHTTCHFAPPNQSQLDSCTMHDIGALLPPKLQAFSWNKVCMVFLYRTNCCCHRGNFCILLHFRQPTSGSFTRTCKNALVILFNVGSYLRAVPFQRKSKRSPICPPTPQIPSPMPESGLASTKTKFKARFETLEAILKASLHCQIQRNNS